MILNEQASSWSTVRPDDYSKATYDTKIGSDGLKYYKPKKSQNTSNTNTKQTKLPDLSDYEGTYTADKREVVVYADNNQLNVTMTTKAGDIRDTLTQVPGSPDKFQTPKGKFTVEFKRDASNNITGATINGKIAGIPFSIDAVKEDDGKSNTNTGTKPVTNTPPVPNTVPSKPANTTQSVGSNGFPLCIDDRNTKADFWILSVLGGTNPIPIAFSDTQQGAFDIETTKFKNTKFTTHNVHKETCLYEPINCDYFSMGSGPQACKVVFLKNGTFVSDSAVITGNYECDTVHGGVKLTNGLRPDAILNEDVVKKLVRENLNKLLK
jgi:hypothetical protein